MGSEGIYRLGSLKTGGIGTPDWSDLPFLLWVWLPLWKLIQKVSFSLLNLSCSPSCDLFSILFLVDSMREIPVELWLIVRFLDNLFRESSGVDVPETDFILNQFKSVAQALFSTIVFFFFATSTDVSKNWLWIEGKGDKLVSQFEARVILRVANKAGLLVFATAVRVVAECSRGEFAMIFKEQEVVCDGAPKLNGKTVVGDAFDSEGFRGLGHWEGEQLSRGFLTKRTFFSQPVSASANINLSTENSNRVSRQN